MAEIVRCDRCGKEETLLDITKSPERLTVTIEVHVWLEKKYQLCPLCQDHIEASVGDALQPPPRAALDTPQWTAPPDTSPDRSTIKKRY